MAPPELPRDAPIPLLRQEMLPDFGVKGRDELQACNELKPYEIDRLIS